MSFLDWQKPLKNTPIKRHKSTCTFADLQLIFSNAPVYQAQCQVGLWHSCAGTARKVGFLLCRLHFLFLFIRFYPRAHTIKRTKNEMPLIIFNLCTVNVTEKRSLLQEKIFYHAAAYFQHQFETHVCFLQNPKE